MRRLPIMLCALAFAALFARIQALPQSAASTLILSEHPAINYASTPPNDAIAALNRKLEAGELHLKFEGLRGYLPSVLAALNVPVQSQILVFSKTSVQGSKIGPQNPRALYFNNSVIVGFVRGGDFVEIASQDPQQGIIFYTLDQKPSEFPRFVRSTSCLTCHESYDSLDVPGTLVRSEFSSPTGVAMRELGSYVVDHRTPLEHRWGGFYVTGSSESMRHMGNSVVDSSGQLSLFDDSFLSPDSLAGRFPADSYLTSYSDMVALMVFDHQMHMMNLLTRINWQSRISAYDRVRSERGSSRESHGDQELSRANEVSTPVVASLKQPGASVVERQKRAPDNAAFGDNKVAPLIREFVDYLLFIDEAPLTARIWGTSGFVERFSSQGPRDSQQRSLYDFDLQEGHLFRYPCSYMIYSPAFDALPADAKNAVYRRMWEILSGQDKDPRYARLSAADRRAVIEILRDTKPDLPSYFQPLP